MAYYTNEKLTPNQEKAKKEIERIMIVCADYYGISTDEMQTKTRHRKVVEARQVAMYFSKMVFDKYNMNISLSFIALYIGGKDHVTVIHAIRRIEELSEVEIEMAEKLDILEKLIMEGVFTNTEPEAEITAPETEHQNESDENEDEYPTDSIINESGSFKMDFKGEAAPDPIEEKPTTQDNKEPADIEEEMLGACDDLKITTTYRQLKKLIEKNPNDVQSKNELNILKITIRREFLYKQIELHIKEIELIDNKLLCNTKRNRQLTENDERELLHKTYIHKTAYQPQP